MNRPTQAAALPNRTCAAPSQSASEFLPRHSPPPEPHVTSQGMEHRALFSQVGSAPTPWLCPFLQSGEN